VHADDGRTVFTVVLNFNAKEGKIKFLEPDQITTKSNRLSQPTLQTPTHYKNRNIMEIEYVSHPLLAPSPLQGRGP